jgi:hypothetical protein
MDTNLCPPQIIIQLNFDVNALIACGGGGSADARININIPL